MRKSCLFFMAIVLCYTSCAQHISKTVDNTRYLRASSLLIPGSFIIYGGLKPFINSISSLDDNIMKNIQVYHPAFHTNAADYLMWVPSAAVYALDAFKVTTENNFKTHIVLDASSIIITGALGYSMRLISKNIASYKTHGTKFPSGHAANAFRGAELFHQELKRSHPLLSYSGFVVATGVGLLRLYNKDHLLSEVITGAGLGILSSKITYWMFSGIKKHRSSTAMIK